jgi:nucleotide-binding universal stress UspA family protein/YHS domain-containing protein
MKVLVPYDGAELSEQTGEMALDLLAQHPIDLLLLHVEPNAEHESGARRIVDAAASRLAGSPAAITPLIGFGRPEDEIVRCADQHGADLIAMSTHGRSLLSKLIVGSVTDRVIQTSPVPVLVLHPPTMSLERLLPTTGRKLRVLAPLDGSDFAEAAVDKAISLLRPGLVEVTLIVALATPQVDAPAAWTVLDAMAASLRARGVTTSALLVEGEAASEITSAAHDGGYDLIAMATHGSGALARALVGSVTDHVIRTSEVPVLVIQPYAMETPHDPVSGEDVDPENVPWSSAYHDRTFAFTTLEHKQRFDGDPEAFIGRRLAHLTQSTTRYDGLARRPTGTLPPPTLRDA